MPNFLKLYPVAKLEPNAQFCYQTMPETYFFLLHFEVFSSMTLLTLWWCFYYSSSIFLHKSQWKGWHGNRGPCHTDYRCSLSSTKQLPALWVWEVACLSQWSTSSRSFPLIFLWRQHCLLYACNLKNKSSFKTLSFNESQVENTISHAQLQFLNHRQQTLSSVCGWLTLHTWRAQIESRESADICPGASNPCPFHGKLYFHLPAFQPYFLPGFSSALDTVKFIQSPSPPSPLRLQRGVSSSALSLGPPALWQFQFWLFCPRTVFSMMPLHL